MTEDTDSERATCEATASDYVGANGNPGATEPINCPIGADPLSCLAGVMGDIEIGGNAGGGLLQCDKHEDLIVGDNKANNLPKKSRLTWENATRRTKAACLPGGSDE